MYGRSEKETSQLKSVALLIFADIQNIIKPHRESDKGVFFCRWNKFQLWWRLLGKANNFRCFLWYFAFALETDYNIHNSKVYRNNSWMFLMTIYCMDVIHRKRMGINYGLNRVFDFIPLSAWCIYYILYRKYYLSVCILKFSSTTYTNMCENSSRNFIYVNSKWITEIKF